MHTTEKASGGRASRNDWRSGVLIRWGAAMLVALIGAAAALGANTLRDRSQDLHDRRAKLLEIENEAHRLNSLEWQALAGGRVSPEIRRGIEEINARTTRLLEEIEGPSPSKAIDRIQAAAGLYSYSVERQLRLLDAGRGRKSIEQGVDRDFLVLEGRLAALGETYARVADRSERWAGIGSTAALLLAIVLVGLLSWRVQRMGRRAEILHAEQRVLKSAEAKLRHQAFHDPLTGLANRSLFTEHVEHALARLRRISPPIAVLFLDLDNFKTINDSLGHPAGDEVLIQSAKRLVACMRPTDTAARLGGDEFAILVEDIGEESVLDAIANRVLDQLSMPFKIEGKSVQMTASIGIATSLAGLESADELLRNADLAMYSSKHKGKGGFERFENHMHVAALTRLEFETGLLHSIDRDELLLHYQPIMSIDSGRIAGFEALARWRHPTRGQIMPLDFIPIAEDTGFIVPLTRWAINESCKQLRKWREEHPDSPHFYVTVNISGAHLPSTDFCPDIASALSDNGLSPEDLVLEITESALLEDPEQAGRRIREFKRLGIRLAIDDFGTGYSSLSYLSQYPLDILKIDKSFVRAMQSGPEDSALAQAIVKLGRSVRLDVIAEGVESPSQFEQLAGWRCPYAQGSLFSAPLDANEVSTLLDAGTWHERTDNGSLPTQAGRWIIDHAIRAR